LFKAKVDAEVNRQVDIIKYKQNQIIDQEVQKQVRIELLKINRSNSKDEPGSKKDSKRGSSKNKNLFTKSIDTTVIALNKNQIDNAVPYYSSPTKAKIPELKEDLKK